MSKNSCNRVKLISYITGDLNIETFNTVKEHISHCQKCQEFIDTFQNKQSDYLNTNPFDCRIALKNENNQKEKHPFFPYRKPLYALAATLMICIVGLSLYYQQHIENDVHVKGNTNINLYVQTKDGQPYRKQTHQYYPHDKIQFSYTNAEYSYFALFSINQLFEVSVIFPYQDDSTVTISRGADIPLPYSIILGEDPGEILYVGFFCKKKLLIQDIIKILNDEKHKEKKLSQFSIEKSSNYQTIQLLTEIIQ